MAANNLFDFLDHWSKVLVDSAISWIFPKSRLAKASCKVVQRRLLRGSLGIRARMVERRMEKEGFDGSKNGTGTADQLGPEWVLKRPVLPVASRSPRSQQVNAESKRVDPVMQRVDVQTRASRMLHLP